MNKSLYFLVFIFFSACQNLDVLEQVIAEDPFLRETAYMDRHEVQIIYTQIDRDEFNKPTFTTYSFGTDSGKYFYPASTVKFPASLLALEKLNKLSIPGLTKESIMLTDSAFSRQTSVVADSIALDNLPSIGNYIKKILLVSDNDAYNRLYEFIGQDDFNQSLRDKGYDRSRIIHRLSINRSVEENLNTNPIRFFSGDSLVYDQSPVTSTGKFHPSTEILKGKGFIRDGNAVTSPFDFTYKNYFPLHEQHKMMMSVIFPEEFPNSNFQLSDRDLNFLYRYMSQLPAEADLPTYQTGEYYDAYAKFLMYGSDPEAVIPQHIKIFNKIGLAYGYAIDNAYIVDIENNIEFFLTAMIHTNENQIFNDGIYEYEEIAFPFLQRIGQDIYELELSRERAVVPNLSHIEKIYY